MCSEREKEWEEKETGNENTVLTVISKRNMCHFNAENYGRLRVFSLGGGAVFVIHSV